MADLRDFRRGVSVLKKQGLLPQKIGRKKLDARTALPDWKVKGKKLSTLVKKYDDVVSGKLTAVSVPPAQLRSFRKAGFETANNRVLVPHTKTETAKFVKGNIVVKPISNKSGIERVQLPIEFKNLRQYLSDLSKDADLINRMKRENEYFGIRFYGGQRANFYSDIRFLQEDLEHYEDLQNSSKLTRAKQLEIYKNLEIVRISPRGTRNIENEVQSRKKKMSAAYNRRHAKRVYQRRKRKGQLTEYLSKHARSQRDYRARLKAKGGKAYADYKRAAKKRAKKSKLKNKSKQKR